MWQLPPSRARARLAGAVSLISSSDDDADPSANGGMSSSDGTSASVALSGKMLWITSSAMWVVGATLNGLKIGGMIL